MDTKHIDFKTVREDFNEYELENKQLLRVKQTIVDIIRDAVDTKNANLKMKDISHVITSANIDTTGMEYSKPETVTELDEVGDIRFKAKKEIINIYETEKAIILVTLKINNVKLTNKKDKEGAPILRYTANTAVNVVEKPSLTDTTDTTITDEHNAIK
jgi:hypothetical protein